MMETYFGYVRTPADAIKLFEACRLGLLPRVQRRLSEKERMSIRSGSVYVWDEREAGMRRWTDGKSWSASRVSGSFLTYREMEGKRGGGFGGTRRGAGKTPDSGRGSDEDQDDGEPDGYRYKVDGLMKQSFSITTSTGQHLHLISYYSRPQPGEPDLPQPSSDHNLRHIVPMKGMYPESSMNEAPMPAMIRTPMQQAPYLHAQQQPPQQGQTYPQQYVQQGYSWPPSPVATPPYSHYTVAPYPQAAHQGPAPPHSAHYAPQPPQSQYHPLQSQQQPPYDHHRAPLPPPQTTAPLSRTGESGAYAHHHPSTHESLSHIPYQPRIPSGLESPRSHSLKAQAAQAAQVLVDPRLGPAPGGSRPPPPAHGPLPALSQMTAPGAGAGGRPGTSPPMRGLSVSPPRSSHSDINGGGGNSSGPLGPTSASSATNKASLSALLLHPTPANSEPSSANSAGINSANSSPRAAAGPSSSSSLHMMNGASAAAAAAAAAAQLAAAQQAVQVVATAGQQKRMPFNEDARALGVLDKKFCL